MATNVSTPTQDNTSMIATILILIFVYPVGVIVMWFWPKWPIWVKSLVSIPLIGLIAVFALGFSSSFNPQKAIDRANQVSQQQMAPSPHTTASPTIKKNTY